MTEIVVLQRAGHLVDADATNGVQILLDASIRCHATKSLTTLNEFKIVLDSDSDRPRALSLLRAKGLSVR